MPVGGTGGSRDRAVNRLGRSATTRTATRSTRTTPARKARRRVVLERCDHGLLKGTCAICLQMEETLDLHSGKLAPEERSGVRIRASEEEEEEEEE